MSSSGNTGSTLFIGSHFGAQAGIAIPLVLWMVAALTMTLSGVVYLSRDGVNMSELRLKEAQSYAIARGAAQLAVRDHRALQTGGVEQDPTARQAGPPKSSYQFGDVAVETTIFPVSGFVAIGEQDLEVWTKLLSRVGGLDVNSAVGLAQAIIDAELSGKGVSSSGGLTFGQIYNKERTSSSGHIEALLGVPGMTRTVYDRIVRVMSPFASVGGVNESVAPEVLKQALGDQKQNESGQEASSEEDVPTGGGYWCVEVTTKFSPSDAFRQRVWVEASGAGADGLAKLVRVEAPFQLAVRGNG